MSALWLEFIQFYVGSLRQLIPDDHLLAPGHGETHHENRIVDLNTAPEEVLADLPMVGRSPGADVAPSVQVRDDVQNVPGFDSGMIDDLKSGGAQAASAAADRTI